MSGLGNWPKPSIHIKCICKLWNMLGILNLIFLYGKILQLNVIVFLGLSILIPNCVVFSLLELISHVWFYALLSFYIYIGIIFRFLFSHLILIFKIKKPIIADNLLFVAFNLFIIEILLIENFININDIGTGYVPKYYFRSTNNPRVTQKILIE